jgi:hypothetical protein
MKNSSKQILKLWIDYFNNADVESLIELYDEDAVNHQVANTPVIGKSAIREMFEHEFAHAEMTCIVGNIYWALMEWKDPLRLRGCGFFQIINNKIVFQRGYWDKLSFLKIHSLPVV